MRGGDATIPSAFTKTDDNISAADSVANVHDMHVFRQNHNILLAKRVRKDLVAQSAAHTGLYPYDGYWYYRSRFSVDGESRSRVMSIPLFVTQATKEIRFWCMACKSALDGESSLDEDPILYAVLREAQTAHMGNLTDYPLTVTSATGTPAAYSVDVPLPNWTGEHNLIYGRLPYFLDIYLRSYIDTTNALAGPAQAITGAGLDWFTLASMATNYTGDAVYTSSTYAEPRQIVKSDNRYWIDMPWTEVPDPGSITVTIREILGVHIFSFGVQELAVTDFTTEYSI